MICKRLTVNQSPSFFFLLSLSSSGAPGALLKERKKIKKDEILVHEKLSSLYNFLLSSLFTFFAPRGASRRAPPKESRELVNKRIVPKEPNFQEFSWHFLFPMVLRTLYPAYSRRIFSLLASGPPWMLGWVLRLDHWVETAAGRY